MAESEDCWRIFQLTLSFIIVHRRFLLPSSVSLYALPTHQPTINHHQPLPDVTLLNGLMYVCSLYSTSAEEGETAYQLALCYVTGGYSGVNSRNKFTLLIGVCWL